MKQGRGRLVTVGVEAHCCQLCNQAAIKHNRRGACGPTPLPQCCYTQPQPHSKPPTEQNKPQTPQHSVGAGDQCPQSGKG